MKKTNRKPKDVSSDGDFYLPTVRQEEFVIYLNYGWQARAQRQGDADFADGGGESWRDVAIEWRRRTGSRCTGSADGSFCRRSACRRTT